LAQLWSIWRITRDAVCAEATPAPAKDNASTAPTIVSSRDMEDLGHRPASGGQKKETRRRVLAGQVVDVSGAHASAARKCTP
jgi:hypothetical protein